MKEEFKIGQIVFYTRILPKVGIYDLLEIKLRTVKDTYIVGCDEKDHTAYLISEIEAETCIFISHKPSTISMCDRIISFNNKKLVPTTYDEIAKSWK